MSDNFLDSSRWYEFYDQNLIAQAGDLPNSYIPIPDQLIGTDSADYVAIAVDSIKAKPNWRLGIFAQFYCLTSFSNAVEFYRCSIPLRIPKVIQIPKIQPSYSIRLVIPVWHEDMNINVKTFLSVIV
jgi:hypothetical protein